MTQATQPLVYEPVLQPGHSPFHVKGLCFVFSLGELERRLPGGLATVKRRLDAPTRAFFDQTFFANSFYDALPLITLEREAARMLGIVDTTLWEQLAALQAETDIQGVYRLLLRFASADKIVESMPKLGKRYFNFVDTSIEVHRPGYSELVVRGLPQPVVLAYKALSHAYLMRTMELAHIRNPRHTWIGISDDGVKAGVPLVALYRRIEWDCK